MPLGIPHSRFLAWDPDDQDKALAYERIRRATCQGCGTRAEEWDQDRFAYVAERQLCPGCELIGQEQESEEERPQKGVYVRLVRRDPEAVG